MTSIESIAQQDDNFAFINEYAPKLGFEKDDIELFSAVIDTVEEILEKKARPNIFEWEEEGATITDNGNVELPGNMESVLNELIKDNEVYAFFIPKEHGGYGYTNLFQSMLSETVSRYDLSLHIASFISLSVIEALTVYYKDAFAEPLEKFAKGEHTGYVAFTEPQAGSNLENVSSTVELDGDEYILNGTKIFISNGGFADAGLFLGKNIVDGEEKGTNVVFVSGREGITAERLETKSGLHANPTAQLHFDNVRVPKENIIYKPGEGYDKVLERLMGMRIGVSAQSVGLARRGYELASQYAEDRVQFGKPIKEFDGVSRKLETIKRAIPRMRAYLYQAAYGLDRYYKGWVPADVGATGEQSEKMAANSFPGVVRGGLAHYYVSQAKLYCSEIANYLLYDAQQIFGGSGFITENEINKLARDVRILNIYEGTSEIHEWIIGRAQDAINMLPKFQKTSSYFEESLVYEDILESRFPGIFEKI